MSSRPEARQRRDAAERPAFLSPPPRRRSYHGRCFRLQRPNQLPRESSRTNITYNPPGVRCAEPPTYSLLCSSSQPPSLMPKPGSLGSEPIGMNKEGGLRARSSAVCRAYPAIRIRGRFPYVIARHNHSIGPNRYRPSHHRLNKTCAPYSTTVATMSQAGPTRPYSPVTMPE